MYIVNYLTTKEEKNELLKTFQQLDLNGDGILTKEELLIGRFKNFMFRLQKHSWSPQSRGRSQ